jgi:hypothetical protein
MKMKNPRTVSQSGPFRNSIDASPYQYLADKDKPSQNGFLTDRASKNYQPLKHNDALSNPKYLINPKLQSSVCVVNASPSSKGFGTLAHIAFDGKTLSKRGEYRPGKSNTMSRHQLNPKLRIANVKKNSYYQTPKTSSTDIRNEGFWSERIDFKNHDRLHKLVKGTSNRFDSHKDSMRNTVGSQFMGEYKQNKLMTTNDTINEKATIGGGQDLAATYEEISESGSRIEGYQFPSGAGRNPTGRSTSAKVNAKDEKFEFDRNIGIWKDKLEIKHQIYRDSILKEDWYHKSIGLSLSHQAEITDQSGLVKGNPLRKLAAETMPMKSEIETLLEKFRDKLQNFLTEDIMSKSTHFEEILAESTRLMKNFSLIFQKCGFSYMAQSTECLWIYLVYGFDLMVKNFDSLLAKSYDEEALGLRNQIEIMRREKEIDMHKLTKEIKKLKTELEDNTKKGEENETMVRELQGDNRMLSEKLEGKKMEPSAIGVRCNALQNDMNNLVENLQAIHFENKKQDYLIANDFSHLLRNCKKQNFFQSDQSTQTDLKFARTAIFSDNLDLRDYYYDVRALVKTYQNPVLSYLPSVWIQKDQKFIDEFLDKNARNLISTYLDSDSMKNFGYVVLENLMLESGFTKTKNFLENLYVLNQTQTHDGAWSRKPTHSLLGKMLS